MNAVDTNVLLYSVDRNEPAKQLKAQQALNHLRSAAGPTILLWQVLGDLAQQLRRWRDQGKLTPASRSTSRDSDTSFHWWFRRQKRSTGR